ncbi:MAG TPA: SIMPL domain-containing protein [Saprospiraceae bacterium]|nr:SIMPL domain-containing protein [Saprospiraceae bacterium]HMQ82387.1 SIMPL domain-containing protein [Saprospiraceae bacterium]
MKNLIILSFCLIIASINYAQQDRVIRVDGLASVKVKPDVIMYNITIELQDNYSAYDGYDTFDAVKYEEQRVENELKLERAKKQLIEMMGKCDIPESAIMEDQFTVVSNAAYYGVTYITLKIEKLEKLQCLIAAMKKQDQFSGSILSTEYKDQANAMKQLVKEALLDAKSKAEMMVKTLDCKLGAVLSIDQVPVYSYNNNNYYPTSYDYDNYTPYPYNYNAYSTLDQDGNMTLQSQVSISFLIED